MNYVTVRSPGDRFDLSQIDPNDTQGFEKASAKDAAEDLGRELDELEDLLFYAGSQSVLVVLQGMDAAGKDGTIRTILKYVNAQSCRVHPFKVPTAEELAHDFLWRVHKRAPGKGSMAIFNRSHYEDVVVVRVKELVKPGVWSKRFEQINQFERLLADAGTTILKFFLHITKDEQEERFIDREKENEKSWKLSVGDWETRELWDEFQIAYADALTECNTEHAPWHVVSANKKWFRDLAVLDALVTRLRPFKDPWTDHLTELGREARAELDAYRAAKS